MVLHVLVNLSERLPQAAINNILLFTIFEKIDYNANDNNILTAQYFTRF